MTTQTDRRIESLEARLKEKGKRNVSIAKQLSQCQKKLATGVETKARKQNKHLREQMKKQTKIIERMADNLKEATADNERLTTNLVDISKQLVDAKADNKRLERIYNTCQTERKEWKAKACKLEKELQRVKQGYKELLKLCDDRASAMQINSLLFRDLKKQLTQKDKQIDWLARIVVEHEEIMASEYGIIPQEEYTTKEYWKRKAEEATKDGN